MSSAVPRSIVRNGQSRRRAIAVAAVLLVLVSSIALLLPDGSSDYTDDDYYVTYHPGSADVTGGYNDVPANGQYSEVTIKYDGVPVAEYNPQFWSGNISGVTSNIANWYAINRYQIGSTIVFTGWKQMDSQGNATGETIDPGEDLTSLADGNNSISLVATWATLSDVQTVSASNGMGSAIQSIDDRDGRYRSIILISGNFNASGVTKSVTIRGTNDSSKLSFSIWNINNDVIIDNVSLNGSGPGTTQDRYGIYANCNKLILGTGIVCSADNGKYVQVFGGPYQGNASYGVSDDDDGAFYLRIFSGTFSNVIGGGGADSQTNGYLGTIDRTSVAILGTASVIESVIGGSVTAHTKETNVLVAGHANISSNGQDADGSGIRGNFSTVIGGSRYGTVAESNVIVTGQAKVFAVQGGGRQANTHTDTTNVTICGCSNVSIVVGSVTDGNPSYGISVEQSNVLVKGSPTIGSVYGGGWDIWAEPAKPSTGKISVVIEGSPEIVNVFGGGFRGSVGVDGSQDETVRIRIEGGSIGTVFGGGSGGEDPTYDIRIVNGVSQTYYGGGKSDTTGPAQVFGNVRIEITGGTIGTVYGGGQGAARSGDDKTHTATCARVYGDVSISVSGEANVGNIYGGGKGINTDYDTDYEVAGVTGSISITIHGSEVGPTGNDGDASGSVYGGGMYSEVVGDVSISVEGSTISGSVYGGGRGLSSNNAYGSVDATNVSIKLNDGTYVGGSVYGGGEYGILDSGTVSMSLIGADTTIGGSVYGGGLGTENVLSTVVSERTIVINGPTINGSVYGGSRNGDDNYVDGTTGSYVTCQTDIYVLSGNIAAGSSGNIYGGAYKGRSKMDVGIYVGSAVPEQVGIPVSKTFSIRSIFGGPSVGEVEDDYETDTVLLFGNTHIEVGGNGYDGSISGDVFGEGDYCAISGTSEVSFEGFSQEGSMLSIQKADTVTLIDTELELDGNVDGGVTSGSPRLSINDIGKLTLIGDCEENGRSGLTLNAQVSSLSAYESVHDGSFTSDSKYQTGVMNYLRLNTGKMFSVLGPSNDGTDMGGTTAISGATLILSDENPYYGALAISGPRVDSTAEFVLKDGSVAGRTSYQYSSGVTVTVWYMAGAFTVDGEVTLVSGDGSAEISIGIPKMATGSEIKYVGHYSTMTTEGSIDIVGSPEDDCNGTEFNILLGTGAGLTYQDGGLDLSSANGGEKFGGSGASMEVKISTCKTFTRTGYAGTVHVHMIEVQGGITIGTFDVEIDIYLRVPEPSGDSFTIEQDLIVKDRGDNQHGGEADVYLPVLNNGAVGTYTLVSVSGIPEYESEQGTLQMSLAATHLNKSGWLSVSWPGGELGNENYDELLGEGGLYSPVLHFDFLCPGHDDPDDETRWGKMTVTVSVEWTDGSGDHNQTYCIVLTPKHASEMLVSFYDKWLSESESTTEWLYPVESNGGITAGAQEYRAPSFTLSLEFGDSLMGLYVAIKADELKSAVFEDWCDYVDKFAGFLYTEGGNVVTWPSEDDAVSEAGDGYEIINVYRADSTVDDPTDLIGYYQHCKAGIKGFVIEDKYPNYLTHFRWYDNPSGPAQFNFYSQVTDPELSLYAGYGVIIKFVPKLEEGSESVGQLWVSPSSVFLENLESAVNLNGYTGSMRVPEGYRIVGLLDESGDKIEANDSRLILNDITVTVVLTAEKYKLTVDVVDEDGNAVTGVFFGSESEHYFDEQVVITIKYEGKQYRILSAQGVYGNFDLRVSEFYQAADNSWSSCSFRMPSGNLHLTIVLADGYTLTVRLPDSSPTDDNDLFGLKLGSNTISVSETGERSVELDIGLNGSSEIALSLQPQYNGHSITVTIGSYEGASAEISEGKLKLTGITGDVVVDLKVNVEWKLIVNGQGYDVIRGTETLTDQKDPTVHTGDVLILSTHEGYAFDSRPEVSGGHYTSYSPYTIAVEGTRDVTISGYATLHQIVLTVHVVFGGDPIMELPGGSLTADGNSVVLQLQGENTATGTVTVGSGGEVVLNLLFEGYINLTETVDPSAREVTLHAVPELRDETGPVEGPTGDFVLVVSAGDADGEHAVTGLSGSGTFSVRDGMSVALGDGKVALSGFSHAVGTVVVEIGWTATLTVVVVPQPVGHGGPVIL